MKQKSLRQLAKELGVSHSYLSQIRHGKRPASDKVVSSIKNNGKQYDTIMSASSYGEVSELADEHDLGSCAFNRRGGSSPPFPTTTSRHLRPDGVYYLYLYGAPRR